MKHQHPNKHQEHDDDMKFVVHGIYDSKGFEWDSHEGGGQPIVG